MRELYAAEITYVDEWIGRLMNKLADEKLLDETVIYYMSDHGLTLGENGVMGKDGARAQWHIYHVPAMIRHPEGKLAGQTSDYFASTHDVSRTLLSFMGVRAPGMMDGEDLSVLFEGRRAARTALTSRPATTTTCSAATATGSCSPTARGAASASTTSATTRRSCTTWPPSTREIVDKLWRILEDEAGGTLPQFGDVRGARR